MGQSICVSMDLRWTLLNRETLFDIHEHVKIQLEEPQRYGQFRIKATADFSS